jgi:hypothetical protein
MTGVGARRGSSGGEVLKFVSSSFQLPSCSGLESSGPLQSRPSFVMVAHLLLCNVPSMLASKFLLTDSFLTVIQFCCGLTHFGSVEVLLTEIDFNGPSELQKMSKE